MMKWKVNESCQGKIITASKILKPPERQRESPHAASEKRPWEKIMSILLSSLLVYMLLIAFCVWLIGVCVALAPFVPLAVFTLVPMCLCDRNSHSLSLCVCLCVFRAPRFKGYQQQDSQELLHYLLDSMRVEETKVSAWFIIDFICYLFIQRVTFGPVFTWDWDPSHVIRSQMVSRDHHVDLVVMRILSSLTTKVKNYCF